MRAPRVPFSPLRDGRPIMRPPTKPARLHRIKHQQTPFPRDTRGGEWLSRQTTGIPRKGHEACAQVFRGSH